MAVPVIFNTENNIYSLTSSYYKTPTKQGVFIFESTNSFATDIPDGGATGTGTRYFSLTDAGNNNVYTVRTEYKGAVDGWYIYEKIGDEAETGRPLTASDSNKIIQSGTYSATLSSQTYTIQYGLVRTFSGSIGESYVLYTGFLNVATNRYPLKKYTITDVIVRACDLIEPLKYTERPRFRFDGVEYSAYGNVTGYTAGSQAAEFDKIIAPEFAFTKMTFREQMQQIGGYIHGEPRITGFYNLNGKIYYTFKFDLYGGKEKAKLKDIKPYVTAGFGTDINSFCTSLDSSVDNLVNQLDWAQGVIIEPFNDYGVSVRSESSAVRLEENNGSIFPTSLPIYQAGEDFKVYVVYIPGKGTGKWDITPYLFEEADYNNLSSYTGTYPYAKCFALYYTQGQRNIKGLFFKSPHAISGYFNNYALLNILRAVTGDDSITLDYDTEGGSYMDVAVQIEYLPIYGERVHTNKSVVVSSVPRTIAYNQNANLIEARYYGENLKGVVARLGNVEKTYTYHLAFFSDIPKAGMLYDENYYISSVSVEVLPTYIRCTVGLSKDFNRLSQYVGISSEKRMWEVSEKQSVKRDSVIREFLVLSKSEVTEDSDRIFRRTAENGSLYEIFNDSIGLVTAARIYRYTKNLTALSTAITLPVVSSASGNSMLFTFSLADNYSAGQKISWVNGEVIGNNSGVSGYFADYIPYSDYYGRFYYLGFEFKGRNMGAATGDYNTVPSVTTSGAVNVVQANSDRRFKYRKDSREVPQITYELTAISDTEDIIIGSALMRNCQFINRNPADLKFYVFPQRLNKISSRIDFTNATEVTWSNRFGVGVINLPTVSTEYESWAIVTERTTVGILVEDEDGNEMVQEIEKGGELVIGGNGEIPAHIYGGVKTDVYK